MCFICFFKFNFSEKIFLSSYFSIYFFNNLLFVMFSKFL